MDEQWIISRIAPLAGNRRELVCGIGDDCAIYRPPGAKEDLVFTTDMLIEDVHFTTATHSAEEIGHKALARGLSDIAAMGAEPRFCLLSLALTEAVSKRWIDGFYRGLLKLARRTGTVLAGGDLSHAEKICCDITVCGAVPRNRALLRSGAKPGHEIYVSGVLGAAAVALDAGNAHRPEPRLDLGLRLRRFASAAMDLSDGLSTDLRRMCVASGVSADLSGELPVAPGASVSQALHGGEDYELLFTLPPGKRMRIPGITCIGVIVEGKPGTVRFKGKPLRGQGYDHFKK
jgi:thiamine-monophosphate kinase